MNSIVVFLFAITLDIHTGEESSRKPVTGPLDVQTCVQRQLDMPPTRPEGESIVVYECAIDNEAVRS
jgi:hypothetical protein